MGVSNNIIAILNFLSLLCSVPIIAAGVWLASKADNECIRLARWPVVILGVLILLVSLAGFVGAYWNRQGLLALYLFAMAALIVLLLALLVFAFVVTKPDGSYPVPGRAYREYRTGGFSAWLRGRVSGAGTWARIQECLSESDVCGKLARKDAYFAADQFFQSDLSPLLTPPGSFPSSAAAAASSPSRRRLRSSAARFRPPAGRSGHCGRAAAGASPPPRLQIPERLPRPPRPRYLRRRRRIPEWPPRPRCHRRPSDG